MAWVERYVAPGGAGAHNGTSEANAWSWDEYFSTMPVAGHSINVKAGVLAATGLKAISLAGSTTVGYRIRGYNTTIGDLDDARSSQLTPGVDMPLIQHAGAGYIVFTGSNSSVSNLAFTQSNSTYHHVYTRTEFSMWNRCRFEHTGASMRPVLRDQGHYSIFSDCSFSTPHASNTTSVVHCDAYSIFDSCVFSAGNSSASKVLYDNSTAICTVRNNLFIGGGIGIDIGAASILDVTDNLFVGQAGHGVQFTTVPSNVRIARNYFAGIAGHAIDGNRSPSAPIAGVFVCDNAFYDIGGLQVNDLYENRNVRPINDSSDPFVNAGADDYTLKPTSNAYGVLHLYERIGPASYRDLGAIQHGGGGSIVIEE